MTQPGQADTDKYSLGYYPAYAEIAAQVGPAGRVLEVGVARGGSLAMWQGLFPGGLVAGADKDPSCTWPGGAVRIIAPQDSPVLAAAAAAASPGGWDLIVDDASHDGALSQATFALLWPQVRPGGWYALEDWAIGYLPGWGHGDSMLRLAESFLAMLEPPHGAVDMGGNVIGRAGTGIAEARFRFSLALLRKEAEAP